MEWHSYENKQTRPIRVIVRNLHPSYNVEEIKEDLEDKGLKIIDVNNKLRKNKVNGKIITVPLPLFMLTFHHTEDIKKIFEIEYICHTKVVIESLRRNTLIPQCKRCQRYGHTQGFCQRQPACVRCAGKHLTVECNMPQNTGAQCFNCGGKHPANYRGCTVAKELQKRRNAQTMLKSNETNAQPRTFQARKVINEMSYVQAAKGVVNASNQNNEQGSVMEIMQQMLNRLDVLSERLDKLESRYTGAIPKRTV